MNIFDEIQEVSIDDASWFPHYQTVKDKPLNSYTLDDVREMMGTVRAKCFYCGEIVSKRGADAGFAVALLSHYGSITCPECKNPVTLHTDDRVQLEQYDFPVPPLAYIIVNKFSPTFQILKDVELTRTMKWYHSTSQSDWHEKIFDNENGVDCIHLGTEIAAADRGLKESDFTDKQQFIYVCEISETASIYDYILRDDAEYFARAEGFDVIRYVNAYEDAGSISLEVKPEAIKILARAKVSQEHIEKMSKILKTSLIDKDFFN